LKELDDLLASRQMQNRDNDDHLIEAALVSHSKPSGLLMVSRLLRKIRRPLLHKMQTRLLQC
jgi:hypothetical protein